MPSPFPGMDPYFEDPAFWEGFHDVFVAECMFALERELPEGYISDVRERSQTISADDPATAVYIPDVSVVRDRLRHPAATPIERPNRGGLAAAVLIPSVDDGIEVRENYIEILKLPDRELVTAIELMSPWNKHGAGVAEYRGKRRSLVAHGVHVVELDLLRRGRRTELARPLPPGDYYAMVFRADQRPDVEVYSWALRDPLPAVPIPLRSPDSDVRLGVAAVVDSVYDRGRYDRKLRYAQPVPPPVTAEDEEWVTGRLRSAGHR